MPMPKRALRLLEIRFAIAIRSFALSGSRSQVEPARANTLLAFVHYLFAVLLMSGSAHALQHANRQIDTANVYKNVGILMFTYAPNNLGLPVGYVADFCSGVLIHPRVFMTAAHCTAS